MTSWKFSEVHVGEEIQSSNHLLVHSLQSLCQPTKMYRRYSWHKKQLMFFIFISSVNDLLKSNWRNCLSSLVSLWAILLQDIGTKWWLLLAPGMVIDFAKWSSRSAQTLTIFSWLTLKNVMEGISLTHRSSLDW